MKKYRAALLMTVAALGSVLIHYWTGWISAVHQAEGHGQSISLASHTIDWLRDTFENLQAEFWQLAIQFALLAGFFEFIKVHTYDEDQEEIKQRLAQIEVLLREQRQRIDNGG
ncbi:MAG: hypothetical protein ACTHQE_11875 [Thermomicrobiales bacterium]|jgi:hypothetical protein